MTAKQLWVLTGGNGAGKTTFYHHFLAPTGLPFINADIIAHNLDSKNTEAMSYEAAKIAGKLRHDMLQRGRSFCFETVFSHPSKIDFIAKAKALNYQVILVYIHLQTDTLNQARVAQRVTEGGHNVPADKIISRIPRTMANVNSAIPLADIVKIYDNSSKESPYIPIAEITDGIAHKHVSPLPEWATLIMDGFL